MSDREYDSDHAEWVDLVYYSNEESPYPYDSSDDTQTWTSVNDVDN